LDKVGRATPDQWGNYTNTSTAIKVINNQQPRNLYNSMMKNHDSSNTGIRLYCNSPDCYCVLQSAEIFLVKFWEWDFLMWLFCVLIIKSGFLFIWSSQPSILTEVTIMLDDYFKTFAEVKYLIWLGIEPQSPSPQPVVIAMIYNDHWWTKFCTGLPSYLNVLCTVRASQVQFYQEHFFCLDKELKYWRLANRYFVVLCF